MCASQGNMVFSGGAARDGQATSENLQEAMFLLLAAVLPLLSGALHELCVHSLALQNHSHSSSQDAHRGTMYAKQIAKQLQQTFAAHVSGTLTCDHDSI